MWFATNEKGNTSCCLSLRMIASSFPFLPHCKTNGRHSQWLALCDVWVGIYPVMYCPPLTDSFAPANHLFLRINDTYFYKHPVCCAFVAIIFIGLPLHNWMRKMATSTIDYIGLSCWDFSNVIHLIMVIHHFFLILCALRYITVLQYSPFVIFLQMVSIPCVAHNRSQTELLSVMISTGCQMVLNLWERKHNVARGLHSANRMYYV